MKPSAVSRYKLLQWGQQHLSAALAAPHLQHVELLPPHAQRKEPDEQGAARVDGGPRRAAQVLGHAAPGWVEVLRRVWTAESPPSGAALALMHCEHGQADHTTMHACPSAAHLTPQKLKRAIVTTESAVVHCSTKSARTSCRWGGQAAARWAVGDKGGMDRHRQSRLPEAGPQGAYRTPPTSHHVPLTAPRPSPHRNGRSEAVQRAAIRAPQVLQRRQRQGAEREPPDALHAHRQQHGGPELDQVLLLHCGTGAGWVGGWWVWGFPVRCAWRLEDGKRDQA